MSSENKQWVEVGNTDQIDMEDLIRFDHEGKISWFSQCYSHIIF